MRRAAASNVVGGWMRPQGNTELGLWFMVSGWVKGGVGRQGGKEAMQLSVHARVFQLSADMLRCVNEKYGL